MGRSTLAVWDRLRVRSLQGNRTYRPTLRARTRLAGETFRRLVLRMIQSCKMRDYLRKDGYATESSVDKLIVTSGPIAEKGALCWLSRTFDQGALRAPWCHGGPASARVPDRERSAREPLHGCRTTRIDGELSCTAKGQSRLRVRVMPGGFPWVRPAGCPRWRSRQGNGR